VGRSRRAWEDKKTVITVGLSLGTDGPRAHPSFCLKSHGKTKGKEEPVKKGSDVSESANLTMLPRRLSRSDDVLLSEKGKQADSGRGEGIIRE